MAIHVSVGYKALLSTFPWPPSWSCCQTLLLYARITTFQATQASIYRAICSTTNRNIESSVEEAEAQPSEAQPSHHSISTTTSVLGQFIENMVEWTRAERAEPKKCSACFKLIPSTISATSQACHAKFPPGAEEEPPCYSICLGVSPPLWTGDFKGDKAIC